MARQGQGPHTHTRPRGPMHGDTYVRLARSETSSKREQLASNVAPFPSNSEQLQLLGSTLLRVRASNSCQALIPILSCGNSNSPGASGGPGPGLRAWA
eukprot:scaffold252751_cov32-Tisochrysis_lutea.AAC.1